MKILITGAAGNLGSLLAQYLLPSRHRLRLLIHRHNLPFTIPGESNAEVVRADLREPSTLRGICNEVDCIVHFAGVLFKPHPEKFLHITNALYARNLMDEASRAGVRKFLLVSFPHVEGETTPDSRAKGMLEASPDAVHSQTRLAAEKYLFEICRRGTMQPIVYRSCVIYARGLKLMEAARRLMSKRLLAVWKKPTWLHLLSLPDFLALIKIGIEREGVSGIYNLGDDEPLILQDFFDELANYWGYPRPPRLPAFSFYVAAFLCETFATVFRTGAPIHRDLIKMGMTSVVADTSRMKKELLPALQYPAFRQGITLL